jgi:hypothetical protein
MEWVQENRRSAALNKAPSFHDLYPPESQPRPR